MSLAWRGGRKILALVRAASSQFFRCRRQQGYQQRKAGEAPLLVAHIRGAEALSSTLQRFLADAAGAAGPRVRRFGWVALAACQGAGGPARGACQLAPGFSCPDGVTGQGLCGGVAQAGSVLDTVYGSSVALLCVGQEATIQKGLSAALALQRWRGAGQEPLPFCAAPGHQATALPALYS